MSEERSSPALPQAILLVLFLIVAGVGVITVIVPQLQDDSEETAPSAADHEPESEDEDEPDE